MQRRAEETYLVQVLPEAKMMTGQCCSSLFLLFVYSSGSCFLYFPGCWSYEGVLPSLSSVSLCLWFSLFERPLSFYTLSVCFFSPVLLTLSTLSPSVCLSPVFFLFRFVLLLFFLWFLAPFLCSSLAFYRARELAKQNPSPLQSSICSTV